MVFVYYSVNTVSVGLVAQLCPVLPDSVNCIRLLYGIILARRPEWVTIPSSRGCASPKNQTHISWIISCIAVVFFTTEPLGKPADPIGECYFGRNGKWKLLELLLIKTVFCVTLE